MNLMVVSDTHSQTKTPLLLTNVHLIGHIARGEGLQGHAALSGRPLLAQLSSAPCDVAWEGCGHLSLRQPN